MDAPASANVPGACVVSGWKAALAMQETLHELGQRTGQADATRWLGHFMKSPEALAKTPYLITVGCDASGRPLAGDIWGAVLIYEYMWKGWNTGIFATDNVAGARTVIAPKGARLKVAGVVQRKLLSMGAAVVLVTVDRAMNHLEREAAGTEQNFWLTTRTRTLPLYLPLENSLDATMAMLGRRTRRNLRSYRRRAECELGAEFVAEVEMGCTEFAIANRRSMMPASEALVGWRYHLLEQTERDKTIFAGVRSGDGRWLSLIGGRRQSGTTEIDWQMNLDGLPRYSLSTVMRAFLLESEIARGTRRLWFEGGTPHPMRHSFVFGQVTDLVATRRGSMRAWAMQRCARWNFPVRNFLSAALREAQLEPTQPCAPPQDTLGRAA